MAVVALLLALLLWSACAFEGATCGAARMRIPAPPGCTACVCQPCACPHPQEPLEVPSPALPPPLR